MTRKARSVAVAKAPKARAADESSSPVLGRAWLPRLILESLTSEDDAEVLIEADKDVFNDSLIEAETLVEALADSDTLNEPETDWLVETEALVLTDSLSDVDSLVETEALMLALNDSDAPIESETDWLVEIEALVLCDSETDVETD